MEKLNKIKEFIIKHEVIIASGSVLFIVLLMSLFLLRPNLKRVREISREQDGIRRRLIALEKKDKALSSIDYRYYQDSFKKITKILAESKDYVSLFTTFDALERKTGVSIIRTDFQLGVVSTSSAKLVRDEKSKAYVIPMSVEISGTYNQIIDFVLALQDLTGRLITVENFNIGFGEDGLVDATAKGKAYFYPLPSQIGKIDTPLSAIGEEQTDLLSQIYEKVNLVDFEMEFESVEVGKRNLFQ